MPAIGSTDTVAQATDSGVPVAQAGAGVKRAVNPLEQFVGTGATVTKEQYDSATPSAGAPAALGGAGKLIEFAKRYVGTPYKWGGNGPLGFDCSGFVQYVFKNSGIDLPRISYQQATYGKRIGLDQAKPGDILAWDFNDRNNGADHVAIYLGGGMMIESPAPGKTVRITKVYGNPWAVSMNL